ncbi:MAG: hypothetical protein ACR2NN_24560 [Bryobacteraceae bacterium]
MDFAAFEHDRELVVDAWRRGEVDYLENISEAAEADFFRHLLDREVLARLAESYPTPRQKEEVPVWLYIASQISLKLHDASYHAFPYVLRSGGLITALGPQVGRKPPIRTRAILRCRVKASTTRTNTTARLLAIRIFCASLPATPRPAACMPGSIAKCPAVCGR